MTRLFDDWLPVLPGKGQIKETAAALLAIAGDPKLVRTESNGTEFLVPAWVAERFTAPDTPPEPVKRRPRARKSEENA